MLHLISMQFQTICRKKGFQLTTFFLTVYTLGVTTLYAYEQRHLHVSSLFHPASVSAINVLCGESSYFLLLFPFLVVLPASFSFLTDRNTNIQNILIGKVGKRNYYSSKLIAGFFATFLTFTIPFLLELVLNCIAFPSEAGRIMGNWPIYSEYVTRNIHDYLFGSFYLTSPYLCHIGTILMLGIFAGCGAIFVMGISTFRIPYKALLFLPFYIFIQYIPMIAGNFVDYKVDLTDYILVFGIASKSIIYYICVMLILLLMGIFFTMLNQKRSVY